MATRTRFLLLRHASELHRPTNSGRWAALALPGARVIDYALPGPAPDLSALGAPGSAVLFPSPHATAPGAARATDRSGEPASAGGSGPPNQVVVLDATWAQARRMLQRLPALRIMPRLALRPRLEGHPLPMRESTVRGGLSTLEAVAAALHQLGEEEAGAALDALHAAAMRRAWMLRRALIEPRVEERRTRPAVDNPAPPMQRKGEEESPCP